MKRITVKEEYCIGCGLCEIYCLVRHSNSRHLIKAYVEEKPRPKAPVIVERYGHTSFAVQCRHCEDAPCLDACISGAMYRSTNLAGNGPILCDEERCVGCWMCVMVCPFGAIRPLTEGKKVASKCNLCRGENEPVCTANCPNEAIVYEEWGNADESE